MHDTDTPAARLVSFWEGPVTWVERLCVASMLHQGHPLTIYSYAPAELRVQNLPADIRDAREGTPEAHAVHRYRAIRKFNMFANLFRVELQRQNRGIWVDLDCYMLRPLVPRSQFVFGLMSPDKLNNAVLRLPADCPMIGEYMAAITADPLHIPWASLGRRVKREVEILLGRSQPHSSQRTNIGPRALTYFAKKHGLLKYALPSDAFYPIANKQTISLVEEDDRSVRSKLTERTVLVHLWRGKMRRLGLLTQLPPPSSYLGAACRQLGIAA
jgi:hypothetical protein